MARGFLVLSPQLIPMVSQALVHLAHEGELGIDALRMLGEMLVNPYELGLHFWGHIIPSADCRETLITVPVCSHIHGTYPPTTDSPKANAASFIASVGLV